MVEIQDDVEVVRSHDSDPMGGTGQDYYNQGTSLADEMQIDSSPNKTASADNEAIPYNIQDYLNQHDVCNAQPLLLI